MQTIKTAALLLAATTLLGFTGAAHAAPLPTKSSVDFPSTYKVEGDVAPPPISGTAQWTSDGDNIVITNSATQNAFFGYTNVTNPLAGYTAEFRFRVDTVSTNANSPFVVALLASDGANSQYNVLGITGTKLYRNAAAFNAAPPTTEADVVTAFNFADGQFHTVRIAEHANSGDAHLWIDDVEVTDNYPNLSFANLNRIYLGDVGGGLTQGQVSVDYLRLDATGTFAPVPEPASVGLAAVASLGLLARRRRAH